MKSKTGSKDRLRLVIIVLFQTLLFSLVLIKFYQVQIIEGEKWEKIAENQHKKFETIPCKRGSFFSNTFLHKGSQKKQPFALDIQKYHIYIDPLKIPEEKKEKMFEKLCTYIHIPREEKDSVHKSFYKKTHFRKILSFVDKSSLDELFTWWKSYSRKEKMPENALFSSLEYERFHPLGSSLGQVLHTVLHNKNPQTNQSIATGGLELIFKDFLEGRPGKKCAVRSAINTLDTQEILEQKEDGADIYLTINPYIQTICEEEIRKGVEKSKAKGGWAIVMDPYTGEILALAQYPFFDPRRYQEYFNHPLLQERTRSKPITDTFEPGSTMKPIIVSIYMKANEELVKKGQEPLFTPEEKIAVHDGNFPGRPFPLKDGRFRKYMNMDLALQKSGNIYVGRVMDRLIKKMGDQWLKKTLEEYGFGNPTGIELPAEAHGVIPTPGKLHPNGTLEWSKPTPYSLAIGHNLLVNSMQMIVVYSAIANGGYKLEPTLVKKIVKNTENKEEILEHKKRKPIQRIISEENAQRLVQSLKYVTKSGGSASLAEIPGYTEAGKTGTSEKIIGGKYSYENYISSFIGFTPAENPKFVLMVVIDEPEPIVIPGYGKNYMGGKCAAPIFPCIAKRILEYLGVAPDDPFGYPYNDPRRNVKKADMAQEIKELRNLDLMWNK